MIVDSRSCIHLVIAKRFRVSLFLPHFRAPDLLFPERFDPWRGSASWHYPAPSTETL